MKIMIVDGQGGGIGRAIIEEIHNKLPNIDILAVGTNANATSNMVKAGAQQGATGENAVLWNAPRVDVIIGPIGVFFANSLAGEISPAVATALACSDAEKIAIPVSRCRIHIVGVSNNPLKEQLEEMTETLKELQAKMK